ncbi:MAG TPA: carboxypeptidase-like regulatory domain-containing protein [Pyrinomonadaceae bacterium]|nr:carboxypeptidase-like regulatory domain-containing protein [Pyrinomonadaceae bacterium]
MKKKTRAGTLAGLCCLLLLAAAAAALAIRAQEDSDDGEPAGGSVVFGRAVYEETGRPVRRARVVIFRPDGKGPEISAITDARGEFRAEGVRAGRYYVTVDAAGIVSPISLTPVEDLQGGAAPDLAAAAGFFDEIVVDGKGERELTVRARRGAALTGRVAYWDGEPAPNVTVHVMRRAGGRFAKFVLGMSRSSMYSLRTDDRGVYRVAGLPPGEYVVAVSEAADHTGRNPRESFMDDGLAEMLFGQQFLMTFHTSAVSLREATVIRLSAGEERADVDITVGARDVYSVAGVVRSRRDGRPVARARIVIRRHGEGNLELEGAEAASGPGGDSRFATTTDAEGGWRFKELPEGTYTISAAPPEDYSITGVNMNTSINTNFSTSTNINLNRNSARGGNFGEPPPPRKRLSPVRRELRVTGDVAEYLIELGEGASVSGTVTVEGGEPPSYQTVWATPEGMGEGAFVLHSGEIDQTTVRDGAFTLDGLAPGRYFIRIDAFNPLGNLYLKSITWNGRDLTREPLEVTEGARLRGVRVVYAAGPGRVTARLVGPRAGAPNGLNVYFVAPDEARDGWTPLRAPAFCSTGSGDSCEVALAPGDYLIVALPGPAGRRASQAEVRARAAAAPRIFVRSGETRQVEVAAPATK